MTTTLVRYLLTNKQTNTPANIADLFHYGLIDGSIISKLEDYNYVLTYKKDNTRYIILTLKGYKHFSKAIA